MELVFLLLWLGVAPLSSGLVTALVSVQGLWGPTHTLLIKASSWGSSWLAATSAPALLFVAAFCRRQPQVAEIVIAIWRSCKLLAKHLMADVGLGGWPPHEPPSWSLLWVVVAVIAWLNRPKPPGPPAIPIEDVQSQWVFDIWAPGGPACVPVAHGSRH